MSTNHSFGINPQKTQHLGSLYHTIDFHTDTVLPYFSGRLSINGIDMKFNEQSIQNLKRYLVNKNINTNVNLSSINISGNQFNMTHHEVLRVIETIDTVLYNLKKRKKMGI